MVFYLSLPGDCIMTIIGFTFNKLSAFKKTVAKGSVKISTNVKITGLEKTNLIFDNKRVALKALFAYKVVYEPEIGGLEFEGDVLFLQDKKSADDVLKQWKDKKTIDRKLSAAIVSHILQKCAVQSLVLARDVGLPAPIPLPKVKAPNVKGEAKVAKTSAKVE